MAQRGGLGPGAIALIVLDSLLIIALVVILVTWPDSGTPDGSRSEDEATAAEEAAGDADSDASEESTEGETDAAEVEVPEDALDVADFVLPSGNIWCEITGDAATCVIESFGFSPPSIDDCAAAESGYRWRVTADGATPVCGEAPNQPGDLTELGYGEATAVGDFLCESTEDGAICRSISTGSGFQIARGGTRTF
ncbi:hypothetical protein [Ruania alba]|uniref:Uncharacterized protein n=1 Tax=Ruania alba TaxID=648782 RepID=A0A1H5DN05_9MICO|nr:hypothetical protein [Ruania alba]SED80275.1 hypothetical protein SAMN04488554_0736 [Ruania alba]